MTKKNARRATAGAVYSAEGPGSQHIHTADILQASRPSRRGLLRALGDALRDGRLTGGEAAIVMSLQRQSARPRWRPTPRQSGWVRDLVAKLGGRFHG